MLSVGDIVSVRVSSLGLSKMQMGTRVSRLEFALEQDPLVQGAFAAIDLKTRGVLALVGGSDITKSQFNRATQAKRQPGSSFKPFLYAAAIESGKYTPVTKVDDSPEVITDPWSGKTWKPQNFEKDEFDGPISLKKALAESKNTVAVKLLLELWARQSAHRSGRLVIDQPDPGRATPRRSAPAKWACSRRSTPTRRWLLKGATRSRSSFAK